MIFRWQFEYFRLNLLQSTSMRRTISRDRIKVVQDRNSLFLKLSYGYKEKVFSVVEKQYTEKYMPIKVASGVIVDEVGSFVDGQFTDEFNRKNRYRKQQELDNAIDRLYNAFVAISRSKYPLTPENVLKEFKDEELEVKHIGVDLDVFGYSILNDLEIGKGNFEKVGRKKIQHYRRVLNLLEDFKSMKKVSIRTDQLDYSVYNSFKEYLEDQSSIQADSTIDGHLKVFVRFTKYCEIGGVQCSFNSQDKRLKRIKLTSENFKRTYLTTEEIKQIACIHGETERTENARRVILVMSLTGISYADLASGIEPSYIESEGKGFMALDNARWKTRKRFVSFVPLPALKCFQQGFTVPSNQKLNPAMKDFLKECYLKGVISSVDTISTQTKGGEAEESTAEKWELISTRVCRGSFSTNLIKLGLNEQLIMRATGHVGETQSSGVFSKHYSNVKFNEAALKVAELARTTLINQGKNDLADWYSIENQKSAFPC